MKEGRRGREECNDEKKGQGRGGVGEWKGGRKERKRRGRERTKVDCGGGMPGGRR